MLQAAMYVSPTGTEQAAFGALVNKMEGAGEPSTVIALALADAISDGVRAGNWPKVDG